MKTLRALSAAVLTAALLTTTPALAQPAAPSDAPVVTPASFAAAATDAPAATDWSAFSDQVRAALASDHDGFRAAALRMVIRHGNRLDVGTARFEAMRIYRNHDDENMRMLAAQALSRIDAPGNTGYLALAAEYERAPRLRALLTASVQHARTR